MTQDNITCAIPALRTPDERFANLKDFDYKQHYIEDLSGYEGVRLHYLDENSDRGKFTFLCLHGEPTWSYLYRKMIPIFTEAGHRVLAPDFFGFGRSDKPVDEKAYTFTFHRNMLLAFIERLDLQNIVLVCQDWGGILGLTLPMDMPERFSKLLVMNTALCTGEHALPDGFVMWRAYVEQNPDLDVASLMRRSCRHLTDEETAAYQAPFPDSSYKAGVRRFPPMVPDSVEADGADISRRAQAWWTNDWKGESFMAVGAQDPVLGPKVMQLLSGMIPGCPEPLILDEAGHFVQEWGDKVAHAALDSFTFP